LDLWKWGKIILPVNDLNLYSASPPFPQDVWKKVQADDHPRILPEGENDTNLFYNVAQTYTTDRLFLKEMSVFFEMNYPNTPLADLVSLKYFRPFISPLANKWEAIIPDHYFNQKAFPRAFLAGGWLLNQDRRKALELMVSDKLELRAVVLLEEKPDFDEKIQPGVAGEAHITHYSNNRVEIDCEATRPCFLFLSDSYYPPWKAWVDGQPAPIYRADTAFRAVPIKTAGRHQVVMNYRPLMLYLGLAVSIISWLLLIGLLFKGRNLSLILPPK
jgi:hypothetical protein